VNLEFSKNYRGQFENFEIYGKKEYKIQLLGVI
jgi:hypothetical protein